MAMTFAEALHAMDRMLHPPRVRGRSPWRWPEAWDDIEWNWPT